MISYNNEIPLGQNEILEHEKNIYEKQLIKKNELPEEINIESILQRKKDEFRDKIFNMPQNIFIIESKDFPPILGRKILSYLYLDGKINAPNCSQITSSMLLGFLTDSQTSNSDVSVQYRPLTNWEKNSIFRELVRNRLIDICFPFHYLDFDSKKEKQCAPDGWKFSPKKAQNLGNGEEHIRDYTISYFKDIIKDGDIIYDPACSTGQFLSSIKQAFPWCITIGQDLSAEMTEYAKDFVDEIYTGDALESPLPDNSVNIMFLRFLNSEIVTTEKANELFNVLQKKVKKGGLIVLFWHTPVLLNQEYFLENWNFKILNSSWYNPTNNTIFQYYVMKK